MRNKAFWEKNLKGLNMRTNLLDVSVKSAKFPNGYDEPFIKSSNMFDHKNKKDLTNNE